LDAMGAIGIARTFAYGGKSGRLIHDPTKDNTVRDTEYSYVYKQEDSTSLEHFNDKLLVLKKLMNTEAGKRIAEKRHDFMLTYLSQFHSEWDGMR